MNQPKNPNLNQISENIYCNSESYNKIYDSKLLLSKTKNILPSIENRYITPNLQFFSKMLRININSVNAIRDQYNDPDTGELDRRDLIISLKSVHKSGKDYIIFAVEYEYTFDYYSPLNTYALGSEHTINNKKCTCNDIPQNNFYSFLSKFDNSVFHFTFHTPIKNNKDRKFRGAFHLMFDSLKRDKIVPYRPFIIDPRKTTVPKRFISWDTFDSSMNNFFTTRNTMSEIDTIPVNEITTFLTRYPHTKLTYSNGTGSNLHYIRDIIKPIYDKFVIDILNPIPTIPTTITIVPAAVEYKMTKPTVKCDDLELIGADNTVWTRHTGNRSGRKVIYGGKRRRKTMKKRR